MFRAFLATAALASIAIAGTSCAAEDAIVWVFDSRDGGNGSDADANMDGSPASCTVLPESGCPSGQVCQRTSPTTVGCVPVGGGALGDLCSNNEDCGRELGCTRFIEYRPAPASGVCSLLCRTGSDCGGGICGQLADGSGNLLGGEIGACEFECDQFTGSGCPAPLVCRHVVAVEITGNSVGADICQPSGTALDGELCDHQDDCAPGLGCLGEACASYCLNNADCGGAECAAILNGTTGAVLTTDSGICTDDCDPIAQTGCVASLTCKLEPGRRLDGSVHYRTRCMTEGARLPGQSCVFVTECTAAHMCTDDLCYPLCAVASPGCPPATTCTTFASSIVVRGTEYGVCVP